MHEFTQSRYAGELFLNTDASHRCQQTHKRRNTVHTTNYEHLAESIVNMVIKYQPVDPEEHE